LLWAPQPLEAIGLPPEDINPCVMISIRQRWFSRRCIDSYVPLLPPLGVGGLTERKNSCGLSILLWILYHKTKKICKWCA
jgi:hypothetical protein